MIFQTCIIVNLQDLLFQCRHPLRAFRVRLARKRCLSVDGHTHLPTIYTTPTRQSPRNNEDMFVVSSMYMHVL